MIRKIDEELFAEYAAGEYEYEEDRIDADFAEAEKTKEEDFDFDSWHFHRYDNCEGTLTSEMAAAKYEALVRSLAKKYEGGGAEYDDLVQIGLRKITKIIPQLEGSKFFADRLKRRLERCISYYAGKYREKKKNVYGREVALEAAESICFYPARGDWARREEKMFEKVRELLTEEEFEIAAKLYAGLSLRIIAADLAMCHMTVKRRIVVIQRKLLPVKPWLKSMSELKCIDIPE